MTTFTAAEKKQLWQLFSNDVDDLEEGSAFLHAISDFEAEDAKHPGFTLVEDVQADLMTINELESSINVLQPQGVVRSQRVDDQFSETYAQGSSELQGTIQRKEALIESIRQKLKLEDYIGNPQQSRVLGVQAMRVNYARHYR